MLALQVQNIAKVNMRVFKVEEVILITILLIFTASGTHEKHCRCCSITGWKSVTVPLICENGSKIVKKVIDILNL